MEGSGRDEEYKNLLSQRQSVHDLVRRFGHSSLLPSDPQGMDGSVRVSLEQRTHSHSEQVAMVWFVLFIVWVITLAHYLERWAKFRLDQNPFDTLNDMRLLMNLHGTCMLGKWVLVGCLFLYFVAVCGDQK